MSLQLHSRKFETPHVVSCKDQRVHFALPSSILHPLSSPHELHRHRRTDL